MYEALQPREEIDSLYVSRKEGGRGLTRIEDSVDASIKRLEDYMEKEEDWLQPPETMLKTRRTAEWKKKTENKNEEKNKSMDCFKRLTSDTSHEKHGRG